jgi:addiction module RelE/StbE family toxin
MITLEWLHSAIKDVTGIADYIYQFNPTAAHETAHRLYAAANLLKNNPEIGRVGTFENTRELVVKPHYLIVYRYSPDSNLVSIVNVVHTSRDYGQYVDDTLSAEFGDQTLN